MEEGAPVGVSYDKGAEDGPNDEAEVGEHGPDADHPDAFAGVEDIFDAADNDGGGDGREEAAEQSADHDAD